MKFLTKRLLQPLVLILILLSLLVFKSPFGLAQSGSNVSGIITSDNTWSSTGSPYNLTGNILVNSGVALTIGVGSTLNLNGFYIMVNGSLIIHQGVIINMQSANSYIRVNGILSAIGTNDNPIEINGNTGAITSFGPVYYSSITFSASSAGWDASTNSGRLSKMP